jgi:hypothetical protein
MFHWIRGAAYGDQISVDTEADPSLLTLWEQVCGLSSSVLACFVS